MKTLIETRPNVTVAILFCAVASGLVWFSAPGIAQTFTILKSFGNLSNIAGANPRSQLAQGPDGTLYGTTSSGESSVAGTVFKIQPDGSGFAVLKWFTNPVEGQSPGAGLSLSGNTLYGTTISGGNSNAGTVFKVSTDGTGFAVLKHFAGNDSDGAYPLGSLALSGNVLYGTTSQRGGNGWGWGAVFKLNTDGTGYTVLKEFGEWDYSSGLLPFGRLTLSGDVLYGTTLTGGSGGGTVFKISTDGTGFCTLKSFTGAAGEASNPGAGLTLSDGVLYGTTMGGGNSWYTAGSSGVGSVFKVNTDGTGYSVLKEFTGSDGKVPRADLILSAGVLYGTTSAGGSYDGGTVFKVDTDGTGYAVLKHFGGGPTDGWELLAGLTLVDGVLYGTTAGGGRSEAGTVFRINTDGTGFTIINDFTLPSDEANPYGGLALSGPTLFGTTSFGGISNAGTIYRVNTDGTGYTVLKDFTGNDGSSPEAGLTLSGGVLYGTTSSGSRTNRGTVFKLNTDGTAYTVLKDFTGSDGASPDSSLVLSGSLLYGTTYSGGSSNAGTVFKMNTDGTGYVLLNEFSKSDGAYPLGGLAFSGSVLYGTTVSGGSCNAGTVFKVNTDGTGFSVLKHFTGGDGVSPEAGLTLSDGVLYGTTFAGGGSGYGTVFKLNADGTGYTVLKHLADCDGWGPEADLTLSGSTLYGTTLFDNCGSVRVGFGTLFKINTDGTGYTVLKHFTGSDGASPSGALMLSSGTLYGTTKEGGTLGLGTVFKLELSTPIALTAQLVGNAIILTWSDPTFALQAAPAVAGTYTSIPDATSPYTNAIAEPQKFFRLVKP